MTIDIGVLGDFCNDPDELFNDLSEHETHLLIEREFKEVVQRFLDQYESVNNIIFRLR